MKQTLHSLAMCAVSGLTLTACETFNLEPPSEQIILAAQDELQSQTEVIAVVNSIDSADLLERKASRRGYNLKDRNVLSGLGFVMLTFNAPTGLSTDVASRELEKLEPHATAGVNHKYSLQAFPATAKAKGREYADDLIAWPMDGCRANFPIGMIDGGVDLSASGLPHSNIIVKKFTPEDENLGAIEHGTAIAELLVGQGRLTDTRLYSAVVISDEDTSQPSSGVGEILRALDWMQTSGVKLVNISLAGPYNRTLDRAVQRAANRGMILVAAVGNDGANATPRYPAAFKNVIAATAVDSGSEIYDGAVRGSHVDFAAPGVEVFIKAQGRYISGTSVATPFITARIASDSQLLNNTELGKIKNLLAENAVDLGEPGRDSVYGQGLIKAQVSCQH